MTAFQGKLQPDRVFPVQETWQQNLERERKSLSLQETLNRNFYIPEPRLRVNRPNPQTAHLEQRSLPTTNMGQDGLAQRAGYENRPPMADFDGTQGRMADANQTTVIPERAVLAPPQSNVSDAFNGVDALRWGECQNHSRVDPKRNETIDALDSHRAPAGDFGVQPLQIGARVVAAREPLNQRTVESRVCGAEYPNSMNGFRDEEHTRIPVEKVYYRRNELREMPESREIVEETQQPVRLPKLDEIDYTQTSARADDMSQYAAQEKNIGDRVERPGRVGAGSVPMGIDQTSAVSAYAALAKNPYAIR
eukprot:jgi/Mesvir1/26537/Mv16192-RA.1